MRQADCTHLQVCRLGCLLLLAGVLTALLAACGRAPASLPAATATVTLSSPATFTPAPTVTLTPTPQVSDVRVTVSIPTIDGQLPGDGRSTVPVRIAVESPPGLEPEGWTAFFRVDGGGMVNPASVPVIDGHAETHYTVGVTSSAGRVTISAIIDIPRLGRAQGTAEFELVRQTVSIGFGQPLLAAPGLPAEIALNLKAEPAKLGGRYPVQISVSEGMLSIEGESGAKVMTEAGPGSIVLQYTSPATPTWGSATLCAQLTDRLANTETCAKLVWGPSVAQLDVTIPKQVLWSVGQGTHIGVLTLDETSQPQATRVYVCYHVAVALTAFPNNDMFPPQVPAEQRVSLPDGGCELIVTAPDYTRIYSSFLPWPTLWVAAWEIYAPGTVEAVRQAGETIFAAGTARLQDPSAVFRLRNGATLRVSNGGSLPDGFVLYAMAVDPAQPVTTVLVRFYMPEETLLQQLDTSSQSSMREVHVVASWNTYLQANKYDLLLTFNSLDLNIDYLSDIELRTEVDGKDQLWRAAYVLAEVDTAALID